MSDVEANDIYPLSVEEYESAEVIAEDVEVEQFFLLNKIRGLVNSRSLFFYSITVTSFFQNKSPLQKLQVQYEFLYSKVPQAKILSDSFRL